MNYRDEFPLEDGRIYLNHAYYGRWPRRTVRAVERLCQEVNTGAFRYGDWLQTEARLRERLRELINAPSVADIALLKNTSEGLSVVAHGLDWRAGDNIVIADQEFPSNRIVWQSLGGQGVEIRQAAISAASSEEAPEAIIERTCDENTRLVSVSSVQYGTGLRMDLGRIGAFCRREGILFCVDAIQSLGALSLDVRAIGADFLAADGHKWMLGPDGIALFYCREELRDRLTLRQYGWHMVEEPLDFDKRDWRVASSACRFECGSPNTLGIHALEASLSLLLEVGMEEVERGVLENSAYLIAAIAGNEGLGLLSPAAVIHDPARRGGIVTFGARDRAPRELFRTLKAAGVACALRGGGIRFSPHFYTPREQLETTMERLEALAPRRGGR
uniref:Selenocysteine lyase/Cysteine desulfurase n=1 Tax=Candidatus Kentrum sp. FM TaxID=2126340 RepID=A0A450STM0_9GAMM|nr:MAG: Selenocysteine lyase/Cysteine desulfurase [Candidatus Kentron sp. FM]VFJ72900.1 MAG: Selenocysteine lyase/Cysteine desulfurase [Candidatus Kentron sp. FM]VFK20166.1 MAG: Selenocysteine lyase/Cysteine desulfurase [Candidatus Kentron sp. FM]